MTKPKKPEARWITEDYPCVILYAHVSVEQAMEIAEHDIGDIEADYGKITSVKHGWVKYSRASEDDLPSCDENVEEGDIVYWITESEKRPKGVVSRVTIPIFDGWE